jgi:hypothetical protein
VGTGGAPATGGSGGSGTGGTGTTTGGSGGTGGEGGAPADASSGDEAGAGTGGSTGSDAAPTGGAGGTPSAGAFDPCTEMPDMMPPALKKTPIAMMPAASQPGQIVGDPGNPSILYVIGHKDGNVYIVQNGKMMGTLVHVDVQLNANNEQGLLSMALHPDFAHNNLFYLLYTAAGGGHIHIEEFQRMSPLMAKSTGNVVFDVARVGGGSFHNGGSIYFNPKDGGKPLLYHSAGNNLNPGASAMPDGVAGRILRHDIMAKTHATYAYGNRNPYRMSIDRLTGDMWIADTGDPPGGVIYFLANGTKDGTNFGYGSGGDVGTKYPPMGGHQGGGGGIIGGVVYRGHKIKGLCGRYFFGMWNTGVIRSIVQQDGKVVGGVFQHAGDLSVPSLTSFGEDGEGEIYMSSQGGIIYKLEAAGP